MSRHAFSHWFAAAPHQLRPYDPEVIPVQAVTVDGEAVPVAHVLTAGWDLDQALAHARAVAELPRLLAALRQIAALAEPAPSVAGRARRQLLDAAHLAQSALDALDVFTPCEGDPR